MVSCGRIRQDGVESSVQWQVVHCTMCVIAVIKLHRCSLSVLTAWAPESQSPVSKQHHDNVNHNNIQTVS